MVAVLFSRSEQCLNPFTMLPVMGPLKRDFLDIYLAMFSGVRNFEKKSAMRVMFFFENFLNLMQISKMEKKIEKKLFVFEIIASELVA